MTLKRGQKLLEKTAYHNKYFTVVCGLSAHFLTVRLIALSQFALVPTSKGTKIPVMHIRYPG